MNANKEYMLLVGTESGRIKIYALADNSRRGIITAHDKVIGLLAWDGTAFASVGSEGRVQIWLWTAINPTSLGAAVMGTGPTFGSTPEPASFGGMPPVAAFSGIPTEMPGSVSKMIGRMPSGGQGGMM